VWDVAFLPSSNALVSAGADGTLRLWNPTTGAMLRAWQAHTGGVYKLSVAPNGKIIASFGEDDALRFWTSMGELLWIYSPAFDLASFAFSPQFPYFAYSIRSDYAGGSLLVMAMFSIPGDVDGDGCVSDSDLLQVLFAFGQTGDWPADVDGNGVVDDGDLLIVLLRFGTGCE
jgi:WD40 repeat protein